MGEYYVAGDCHGINDFLLWVVSGKTPSEYDKISIDGYCVLGAKGTWFEPVDINDNDTGFIPALLPRLSDFRIRSVDLEAVESKPATSGQALTAEAPMHGKERAHYLKVIAALLSKAKISKSEPVTRVLMMLEAAGQTSINRETLGKTLNDANSLRQ